MINDRVVIDWTRIHHSVCYFRILRKGLSNAEIASRLSNSLKTVEGHVSAILAKLEVRSRAQAITAASALGLLPHPSQERATPNRGNAHVS